MLLSTTELQVSPDFEDSFVHNYALRALPGLGFESGSLGYILYQMRGREH